MNSFILSCGSYLPNKIVTNSELEKLVNTSDEWITERTGIKKRHIAADDELTSDLASKAAKSALNKANISADEIDMIIVATTTPDLTFPSTATIVQSKIGAKNAFAFDVQAVCSGFVYALTTADNFIKSGQAKKALVIGAETISRIVNWEDRNSCVLFGDGAGAVILSATDDKDSGILASKLYSDGNLTDALRTTGGVSSSLERGHITMSGREVFKFAVEKMSSSVLKILEKTNLTIKDVDWMVPHQANARILSAVAKKIGLSEEKVIMTVANHANTSAASIPLALDYAINNNKIKKGDIVVLEALGGGITWGAMVIKWHKS